MDPKNIILLLIIIIIIMRGEQYVQPTEDTINQWRHLQAQPGRPAQKTAKAKGEHPIIQKRITPNKKVDKASVKGGA